jgi:hypothetical protein
MQYMFYTRFICQSAKVPLENFLLTKTRPLRAARPGHRAGAVRVSGLRPENRAVDGEGSDPVRGRGCGFVWVLFE